MLGRLPANMRAQTAIDLSKNVPIKVVGMGTIRRSMHVIGFFIDEDGNDQVTSTVSVLQYSNHDGASQAQQIERSRRLPCSTTRTCRSRCSPRSVAGSRSRATALTEMPEWRRPASERRA